MNHLCIGLGGTGGRILREIRKTIAADPESSRDINLDFLYVDTDAELMRPDGPAWQHLGKSFQLTQSQQLLIKGVDVGELLANVHAYPHIQPWMEPVEVFTNLLKTNVDSSQSGQRRKFARLLFAAVARQFLAKLTDRIDTLRKRSSTTRLTFHVCAGLAGGTGSGMVVDVVTQIRKAYPDTYGSRILIYVLLPDELPKPCRDAGSYHANGYATLMELNALDVGSLMPHDLAESGQRLVNLQCPVFNGCYAIANEKEGGAVVDAETELPRIVGDFIYRKTLAQTWVQLRRSEDFEDAPKYPERSLDGKSCQRSKRFLTFGIRRLVVPQDEIVEYLSYNFAVQAARQLMFNNWREGFGYADEAPPAPVNEEVSNPDTQNRWKITDEHLTSSRGILPQDEKNPRWKPIAVLWALVVPQHKTDIQASVPRKVWLDELKKRCARDYSEGYRALGGVRKFYETKLKDKADIAREIRNNIERELFEDWKNGQRSISEISRLLAVLSNTLEEKISRVDERVTKLRAQDEGAMARISEIVLEWNNINWLKDLLGKGDKLFNQAAEHLTQQYVYRTYAEGWQFAKKLLEELNQQIIDLRSAVERTQSTLAQAAERFEGQSNSRLADEAADGKGHRQRIYNRDAVLALNKRLITDEDTQKKQASEARSALIAMLGEDQLGFAAFNRKVDPSVLQSKLEEAAEAQAVQANAAVGAEHSHVLNMNVIDKLFEEYGSNDEGLAAFVRKTIAHADVYLTFDPQESGKQGLGTDSFQKRISSAGLFLPLSQHREDFRERLQLLFVDNRTSEAFDVITEGTRPNEITLIRVDNLFPVRFARPLKFLRRKYEERRASSADARYLLHGEGDGSDLPPLFIPDLAEVAANYRTTLLLARAIGLIKDKKNASGRMQTVFSYEDEDGLEQEDVLDPSKRFITIADDIRLDLAVLNAIEREVMRALAKTEFKNEEAKRDLVKSVSAIANEVKAEAGGDAQDSVYKRFAAEVKQVKARLGLET